MEIVSLYTTFIAILMRIKENPVENIINLSTFINIARKHTVYMTKWARQCCPRSIHDIISIECYRPITKSFRYKNLFFRFENRGDQKTTFGSGFGFDMERRIGQWLQSSTNLPSRTCRCVSILGTFRCGASFQPLGKVKSKINTWVLKMGP